MNSDRVLVCDPSPQTQRALRVILREAGYDVVTTATARDALAASARERPRAVILELALPDRDGIELCRGLRRRLEAPILVLSAIDEAETKIAALRNGADDYITKPFSPGELLARLAARLRESPSPVRIENDGLVIDLVTHIVTLDGEEIELTATEFALCAYWQRPAQPSPAGRWARKVWRIRRGYIGPQVRSHVANLRRKLDRGDVGSVIRTDVGVGYRFVGHDGDAGTGTDDRGSRL